MVITLLFSKYHFTAHLQLRFFLEKVQKNSKAFCIFLLRQKNTIVSLERMVSGRQKNHLKCA